MAAATDVALHPVVVMEALIGLADTERHDDDMGAAEEFYRKAAEAADEVGFESGALRARLPLAYLVRRSGSAEEMLAMASDCEARARRISDRV